MFRQLPRLGCICAVCVVILPTAAAAAEPRETGERGEEDRQGPQLEAWPPSVTSADGRHSLTLTARLHVDGRLDPSGGDHFDSGLVIRRARLGFRATVFDRVDFDVAIQNSVGSFSLENAFVELKLSDRFRLRAGNMLLPFSLARRTTSNALVHPERAVVVEKLESVRDVGVMLELDAIEDRLELQFGTYGGSNRIEPHVPPELVARVRTDPAPGLTFDGAYHWSLPQLRGALPSDARTVGNELAPVLVYNRENAWRDGGRHRISTGARVVTGPVMMQAEALIERTDRVEVGAEAIGGLTDWGGFVDVAWALTGERQGEDELEPSRPLRRGRPDAIGAWQLAARYEVFVADENALATGVARGAERLQSGTGSLIWTPVPGVRWLFSYSYARLGGAVAGPSPGRDLHAVITRLDLHF